VYFPVDQQGIAILWQLVSSHFNHNPGFAIAFPGDFQFAGRLNGPGTVSALLPHPYGK